jgi:hypothetical protein
MRRIHSVLFVVVLALTLLALAHSLPVPWGGSVVQQVRQRDAAVPAESGPLPEALLALDADRFPARVLTAAPTIRDAAFEVVVRTVSAETGEVLGGAVVTTDPQQLGGGAEIVTGSDGIAVVPLALGKVAHPIVSARYQELYGELWGSSDEVDGPRTVFLHPDSAVKAHVRLEDGSPAADAPVALRIRSWPVAKPALISEMTVNGHTDADGVVVFEHVGARFRRHTAGARVLADCVASLPGLGVSSARLSLDVPEHLVELVRPATSSASIELEGDEGGALIGALCRVEAISPGGTPGIIASEAVQAGRALLRDLLPNAPYRIEIEQWGRTLVRAELRAPPPQATLRVSLKLTGWHPVSATLTDEAGAPLTMTSVMLVARRGVESLRLPCTTDDAGRVAVWLEAEELQELRCWWQVATGWPDRRAGMQSDVQGCVQEEDRGRRGGFPETVVSHRNLEELARGRVLDDASRPLEVAMVRALRFQGAREDLDIVFVPPSDNSPPGEFLALGSIADREFVVQVAGKGWFEEAICIRGDRDLRIVHAREGAVAVVIDDESAESLRLVLRGRNEPPSRAAPPSAVEMPIGLRPPVQSPGAVVRLPDRIQPSGTGWEFMWENLARGTYDLEIYALGSRLPCCVVDGLVLHHGRCIDSRLQRIVLGSMVQSIRLDLLDESGAKLTRRVSGIAVGMSQVCPQESRVASIAVNDSAVAFLADPSLEGIRVCMDGYRPFDLPQGVQRLTVQLKTCVAVRARVRLADGGEVGTKAFRLRATRVGASLGTGNGPVEDVDTDGRRRWFDVLSGGICEMTLPTYGTYNFELAYVGDFADANVLVGDFAPKQAVVSPVSEELEIVVRRGNGENLSPASGGR